MRLTTFLLIIAFTAYIVQGFNAPKCEHVFTQVEQAVIKIDAPAFTLGGQVCLEYGWPSGLQDGKDIVCVKCFHVQKQKLDYGPVTTGPTLTERFTIDSTGMIIIKSSK